MTSHRRSLMALNLSDSTPLHHPMSQPRFCNNFDVAVCFPARNPIILLPRCSFYFRHTSGIRLAVIRTSLVHNQQPDPFALVSLTPSTIHNESSTRHSIVLPYPICHSSLFGVPSSAAVTTATRGDLQATEKPQRTIATKTPLRSI
jgi:hypothetical protein